MKHIESVQNPAIRLVQHLLKKGVGDPSERRILVEGEKLVQEGVRSGIRMEALFVEAGREDGWRRFSTICHVVPPKVMVKISSLETPPAAAAVFVLPELPPLSEALSQARTLVVLDRVQDPGNVGNIIRTCEALNADMLILLKGACSKKNQKVVRAAMGSSFRFPVYEGLEPHALFSLLSNNLFTAIGTDAHGTNLNEYSFPPRTALLFGSEGRGLADSVREICHTVISIPINSNVESLNVGASVAICLHERARTLPQTFTI